MLGLLQVRGKRLDGASTPSSAPPSPTAGLRRNLSSSDLLGGSALQKAAAFERKKGGMGVPRKWVRFDRNGETSVIQVRDLCLLVKVYRLLLEHPMDQSHRTFHYQAGSTCWCTMTSSGLTMSTDPVSPRRRTSTRWCTSWACSCATCACWTRTSTPATRARCCAATRRWWSTWSTSSASSPRTRSTSSTPTRSAWYARAQSMKLGRQAPSLVQWPALGMIHSKSLLHICVAARVLGPTQKKNAIETLIKGGAQVAFIEELQRRLTPKEGPLAPEVSQSVPDLAAAVAAAEQREAQQSQQQPFELRALEVVLDMVRLTFQC